MNGEMCDGVYKQVGRRRKRVDESFCEQCGETFAAPASLTRHHEEGRWPMAENKESQAANLPFRGTILWSRSFWMFGGFLEGLGSILL